MIFQSFHLSGAEGTNTIAYEALAPYAAMVFFMTNKRVLEFNVDGFQIPPISHCRKMVEHDDVIKWNYFPRYWPFARGIHRSLVYFPHKGQWSEALIFSYNQAALRTLFPYVRPSVRHTILTMFLSSHRIILKILPLTDVMSVSKVNVRDQKSMSHRSRAHLAVSGL